MRVFLRRFEPDDWAVVVEDDDRIGYTYQPVAMHTVVCASRAQAAPTGERAALSTVTIFASIRKAIRHRLSIVDLTEFDALAQPLGQQSAASTAQYGFPLVEGHTATADEFVDVEQQLGVTLPAKYKSFMMRYGAGMFGYVDLFPIVSRGGNRDDVMSVNDKEFPDRRFIAVAPVGTGDHWGFSIIDGRCQEQVWFHSHETRDLELDAADFLEFVAHRGLRQVRRTPGAAVW